MQDIDQQAFTFVPKIIARPVTTTAELSAAPPVSTLKGAAEPIDLGEVEEMTVTQFDELDYSTKRMAYHGKSQKLSLSEADFGDFKHIIEAIAELKPFQQTCDLEFLIKHAFKWLITVYLENKAAHGLIDYLLEKESVHNKSYHFYFQLPGFSIDEPFAIGHALITDFSADEIKRMTDHLIVKKPDVQIDSLLTVYEPFFKGICCKVIASGVPGMAEQRAMRMAELAIAVLKCFFIPYSVDRLVRIFDLDYRMAGMGEADYMCLPDGELLHGSRDRKKMGGVAPCFVNSYMLAKFRAKGLERFSDFLRLNANDEVYDLIINLIQQLADIVSTRDNHQKVVRAISVIENIVIPKDASGRGKGLTRIKKALPFFIPDEKDRQLLLVSLNRHYHIRDKYLHNNQRLPLDKLQLTVLLDFERIVILRLIDLHERIKSLDELYEALSEVSQ